jgi:hypothetical protein
MVDSVFVDFPHHWQVGVVMDWSHGFWDKMQEKHKIIDSSMELRDDWIELAGQRDNEPIPLKREIHCECFQKGN